MSEGSSGEPTTQSNGGKAQRRPWAFVLFALPIAAVVVPVIYNRIEPRVGGVPFFVWYQFAAVVFGAFVTGVVYVLRGTEGKLTACGSARGTEAMGAGRAPDRLD